MQTFLQRQQFSAKLHSQIPTGYEVDATDTEGVIKMLLASIIFAKKLKSGYIDTHATYVNTYEYLTHRMHKVNNAIKRHALLAEIRGEKFIIARSYDTIPCVHSYAEGDTCDFDNTSTCVYKRVTYLDYLNDPDTICPTNYYVTDRPGINQWTRVPFDDVRYSKVNASGDLLRYNIAHLPTRYYGKHCVPIDSPEDFEYSEHYIDNNIPMDLPFPNMSPSLILNGQIKFDFVTNIKYVGMHEHRDQVDAIFDKIYSPDSDADDKRLLFKLIEDSTSFTRQQYLDSVVVDQVRFG